MADEIGIKMILVIGDMKIEVTESEARALHKKLSDILGGAINFPSPLYPHPYQLSQFPSIPKASCREDFSGRYDVKTVGFGQSRGEAVGVSICGGDYDPNTTHTFPFAEEE